MKDMSWPRSIKGKNNNDLQYSISAKDGLAVLLVHPSHLLELEWAPPVLDHHARLAVRALRGTLA